MTNNCWPSRAPKKSSPESRDSTSKWAESEKRPYKGQKPIRRHRHMNTLSPVHAEWTSGCEFTFTLKKNVKFFQKPLTERDRGKSLSDTRNSLRIQIFKCNARKPSRKKTQEILPEASVDCRKLGRRTSRQPPPCRSCGGRLRTGQLRRSAAHVATMSAGRRCLLRHAEPWSPCSTMSTTGLDHLVTTTTKHKPVRALSQKATELFLLLLLLGWRPREEEGEGASVDSLTCRAGQKRHGQQRHWGSHVTDRLPLPAAPARSGRRAALHKTSSVPVGLSSFRQPPPSRRCAFSAMRTLCCSWRSLRRLADVAPSRSPSVATAEQNQKECAQRQGHP